MKKLLFLCMSIATLVSCSKDDDGGNGGSAAAGTIEASVDGSSFASMEIATTAVEQDANGATMIRVQGSNSDGEGMVLTIMGFEGTGTYEINGSGNLLTNAIYTETDLSNPMDTQTWLAPYDESVAGEIKVSEKTDTNIKGTFSFSGKNEEGGTVKEVTNGSFNVGISEF
ncbi:DUF6252 family protein [Mesonia sp.]|uniref:DUF6252 family protein n=1 Tax=Mesonia sp. TaxID=1960830 RepID=UPI0017789DF2|nr:DUF6252 family protein [Mesonia sp.]HIB36353.1 hypothetical protein [Mesonia sp.]HIO26497.1 hypothetical protein [Flavobacteriaceae bacterium]